MKKMLTILFFSAFVLAQVATFAQDGQLFKWKQQSPQGNTIRFLKMFDANNWYVAGFSGLFMKTSDGGTTGWMTHKAGVPHPTIPMAYQPIYDGHFFNNTTGVLVGVGGITRTTDGGNTWAVVFNTPTTGATLYQVYFKDATNGYACGTSGNLVKTTDAGATWTAIVSGTTSSLYDVFSPDGTFFLVTSTSGLIRQSTDAGTTWTVQTALTGAPALYKMTFKDNLVGVVTGSLSKLYLTTDGGLTWTDKSTGLSASSSFYDLKWVGDTVYVTGNSFNINKSTDRGTTWTLISPLNPTQRWTSTYYATDIFGSRLVTGGGFGLIQKVDAGVTPVAICDVKKAGTTYDIWAANGSQKAIAVGAPSSAGVQDQFMTTTDGGSSWFFATTTMASNNVQGTQFISDEQQPEPVKGMESDSPVSLATFRSISMIDNNNGWAAGSGGAVYKTTNGGTSWDSVAVPLFLSTQTAYKIDFMNATTGWLYLQSGDTSGTVLKTTDGGTSWNKYKIYDTSAATNHQIYASSRVNANYQWIVNWLPRPFKTTNGGLTWTRQSLIDNFGGFLYGIRMLDTLTGFACGSSGSLYKTTNGGALWDTVSYGKNTTVTWYGISGYGANNLLLTGSVGALLISTDAGTTWTWQNTAYGLSNYASAFGFPGAASDSAAIYVGLSGGAIFKMDKFRVPVELTSLSSSVNGSTVTLSWSTVTETNNSGYEIERAINNGNFAKIGRVNGNGTSLQLHSYSFVDAGLQTGRYSYRIKQIDFDGSYKYYDLNNSIEIGNPVSYNLSQNYPNPFNPATVLNYSLAKAGMVSLKVYNVLGKEVFTVVNEFQQPGVYNIQFSSEKAGLSSGIYFYTISAGDFRATKKMMLLK